MHIEEIENNARTNVSISRRKTPNSIIKISKQNNLLQKKKEKFTRTTFFPTSNAQL